MNKTLIYDFKNNLFSRKPEIVTYISCFGLFYDQNKDYNIHYIIFVCSYSVSKYNMSLNGSRFSKGERKGPQMSNICNQGGRGHLIVNYTGLKNFISSDSISWLSGTFLQCSNFFCGVGGGRNLLLYLPKIVKNVP